MIIMIATIAVLSVIGYILGSLISRHQGSIPTNLDSARAFAIAQSGVEYIGKYLEGADFATVANPSTKNLETGTFDTAFSGATTSQIVATITGISGTATRQITVRYQKKGGAIMSRGLIDPGTNPNGTVVCDATTNCNNATIHTCACTRENVPASVIPVIPVPSPAPGVITDADITGPAPYTCDFVGTMGGSPPRIMNQGIYYCGTVTISKKVGLAGPVTIFCDNFTISQQSYLNSGGQAGNLTIIASSTVNIENNTNLTGAVYAPGATITQANSSLVKGMMVGNFVDLNNYYTVEYDPSAGSNTPYTSTISALAAAIDWRDM